MNRFARVTIVHWSLWHWPAPKFTSHITRAGRHDSKYHDNITASSLARLKRLIENNEFSLIYSPHRRFHEYEWEKK
jgi:hypothetical protein